MRYFDDLEVGETIDLGQTTVSEAGILEFARQFDPQPFHVDPEAAAESVYGGLIASGWHTCAMFMRMLASSFLNQTASLGSPGVDELRWKLPVRPGDQLTGTLTIVEARASSSKPDRGLITSVGEVRNGDGDVVLSLKAVNLIGRRPE